MKIAHTMTWIVASFAFLAGNALARNPHTPIEAFQQLQSRKAQRHATKLGRSSGHLKLHVNAKGKVAHRKPAAQSAQKTSARTSLLKKPSTESIIQGHEGGIWRNVFGTTRLRMNTQAKAQRGSQVKSTRRSWMGTMFLRLRSLIAKL